MLTDIFWTWGEGPCYGSGYDFVQGLRTVVDPILELIADLHQETMGPASTAG